jgi:hypothetical protein
MIPPLLCATADDGFQDIIIALAERSGQAADIDMFQHIIIALAALAGLGFSLVGGVGLWRALRFRRTARQAIGAVTGITETMQRAVGGNLCLPRVRYETPDGRPVEFEDRSPAGRISYRVGQPVPVWYDPGNPADARIATSRLWLDPALTLLFGIGLLAVAGHWISVIGE